MKSMDVTLLKKCFLAGAKGLADKKEYINDLNVFPVPDGDTGTNMTMTMMSAVKEVEALSDPTMKELAKAISSGSLRGARGNSGVILSQLFRGFTKEIALTEQIDAAVMARAFEKAVESAYRAVMKPKEGTILTVARAGAEKAHKIAKSKPDMETFAEQVLGHMRDILAKTPDMLPVLKDAGVVDSGGEGLVTILEAAYRVITGKETGDSFTKPASVTEKEDKHEFIVSKKQEEKEISHYPSSMKFETEDIKFGYCTEFIILTESEFDYLKEIAFKTYLEAIGDSIVCVADEDLVKIHVHTNDPGLVLQEALTYGSLTSIKIDNMREEHNEKVIHDAERAMERQLSEQPRKDVAFISVSVGAGLHEIFKGLGVDYVIEGGQTMNPSTEDILEAIGKVNADTIYVLPNNSNIILAAEQAKALTKDKEIAVVPTKNIPQGISALINYIAGSNIEENLRAMKESMEFLRAGQVTYAVRDTVIDGKEIKQGNIMGLSDKTIEAVGTQVLSTTIELVEKLMDEDSELVTLYYGSEATEDEANLIAEGIEKIDPDVKVEVHYGGQPIYYYFVSVE